MAGEKALTSILKSGPAMVVTTLLALGFVGGLGWKARGALGGEARAATIPVATAGVSLHPNSAVTSDEVQQLRSDIKELTRSLDALNTRLANLEGRFSMLPLGK